jgi:NADH:ubiquinone oxidoreductase subunit E
MSGDFATAGARASGHFTVSQESKTPYPDDVLAQLHTDADAVIARYPQARSALLPLLHLVQSIDGFVSGRGIAFCAEKLDLETAEVSGVATFYTQYKRHPNGEYTVGVCTNTLCAIMGGDAIWDAVSDHLGVGHDETTPTGRSPSSASSATRRATTHRSSWPTGSSSTTSRSGRPRTSSTTCAPGSR